MSSYIPALLLLIVLFVGFGLTHRRGQGAAKCSGCSDSCDNKSGCSNEEEVSR